MEQAPARVNLKPCKVCGRTFNEDVLPKHLPICQKNAKKKRKVFDSGKQRAAGSDVPYSSTIKPGQAPKADPTKYQKAHEATRNNWKYKHEQFIQGMRAARGAPPLKGSSGGGAPPPTMNTGMEGCRFCGRTFNPDRIEKHEQICGAQAKRAQKDVGNKGRGAPVATGRGAPRGGANSNRPSPAPVAAASPATAVKVGSGGTRGGAAGAGNTRGGSVSKIPSGPAGRTQNNSAAVNNTGSNRQQQQQRNSGPQYANVPQATAAGGGGGAAMAKFCGGCGTKFSGTTAKFCYECGAPRGR